MIFSKNQEEVATSEEMIVEREPWKGERVGSRGREPGMVIAGVSWVEWGLVEAETVSVGGVNCEGRGGGGENHLYPSK
jgi:hypothetical protein